MAGKGLLLSDDLLFNSRIIGTARSLGLDVRSAKDTSSLQRLAAAETPSCIIIDLANPGLNVVELMTWLHDHCRPLPRVVAYGSHVDTATLKNARQAGCDPVLPRSKFVEDLLSELPKWCQSLPLTTDR
jgi:CheY-like chemotaxis protein